MEVCQSEGKRAVLLVLTLERDHTKAELVQRQSSYMRWLRAHTGRKLEYAATYENTKKGRLHVNLVITDWPERADEPSQAELQEQWGAIVFVSEVWGSSSVAKEVTKTKAANLRGSGAYILGRYLSKVRESAQTVTEDRRVSFSKRWPKMPPKEPAERVGQITWAHADMDAQERFKTERNLGYFREVRPGEWEPAAWMPDFVPCRCFDFVDDLAPPGPGDGIPAKPRPSQGPTTNMEAIQ